MANIAQRTLEYYDSRDFKNNYREQLDENFHNDKDVIIDRIQELFNVRYYEVEKQLSNRFYIDRANAKKIYDFIYDNIDSYVRRFNSHYVGYTSLCSVSFGEQEEQLSSLRNHKTGKDYTKQYLRKVFDEAGFYVSGDHAYHDLTSHGMHIDLLKQPNLLNEFLLTINDNIPAENQTT
jgi:hypothetical protein